MGCVYVASNMMNGRQYVGWVKGALRNRMRYHLYDATNGSQLYFHRAIRKYGFDKFEWEILFECNDPVVLKEKEIFFIAFLGTKSPGGYNLTRGGDGVVGLCDEVRKRISLKLLGRKASKATRLKQSIAATDRPFSLEHRKNLSLAMKGRKLDPEVIARIAAKRRGQKLTPEHRAKIRMAMLLLPVNPATLESSRRKISAAQKGRSKSEEHKKKISKTLTGRKAGPCSEDKKKKISIAIRRSWSDPQRKVRQLEYLTKRWANYRLQLGLTDAPS